MSDLHVRTDNPKRPGFKTGQIVGNILVIGIGALAVSGIIWCLVGIWRAIL